MQGGLCPDLRTGDFSFILVEHLRAETPTVLKEKIFRMCKLGGSQERKGTILGTRLPHLNAEASVIWTDDAELRPHADRAWMRAYASAHSGIAAQQNVESKKGNFVAPEWALERHTCLFGATGGGKSRLALHLVSDHLRQGGSALVLDPKPQTIAHLLDRCRMAGMEPEQIVVLDPADPASGIPGWNPLITGLPPAQAAADLVSTLKQDSEGWGPRLSDILISALVLLSAHQLSLFELPRLLNRKDYRMALLRLPFPDSAQTQFQSIKAKTPSFGRAAVTEAYDFFAHEFSTWAQSERAGAISPVLRRVRALLGSDYLQPLLCAQHNTLDLATLWQRPSVVLVHLDRTTLGDDGARLLGGLLAHQIYRTALRSPGPVPVLLALDELGAQERFIGSALIDIVTVGRSQNLRLLAATQHLAGLSTELREALLANAGVQASFQTGYDDARLLGSSYAVGAEETLSHASATVAARDRHTGLAEYTTWRHLIRDGNGHALRLSKSAWEEVRRVDSIAPPGEAAALERVQSLAASAGATRLFVHAADTEQPIALSVYLRGVPEEDYWFDGPAPLELVVSFPRPKFTNIKHGSASDLAARWTRDIHQLPTQHAAVRVRGSEPEIIRILNVEASDGTVTNPDWTSAARAARTQSVEEIENVAVWRSAQVERIAAGQEEIHENTPIANSVSSTARVDQTIPAVPSAPTNTLSPASGSVINDERSTRMGTDRISDSVKDDSDNVQSTPPYLGQKNGIPQHGAEVSAGVPLRDESIIQEVDEDGSIA